MQNHQSNFVISTYLISRVYSVIAAVLFVIAAHTLFSFLRRQNGNSRNSLFCHSRGGGNPVQTSIGVPFPELPLLSFPQLPLLSFPRRRESRKIIPQINWNKQNKETSQTKVIDDSIIDFLIQSSNIKIDTHSYV